MIEGDHTLCTHTSTPCLLTYLRLLTPINDIELIHLDDMTVITLGRGLPLHALRQQPHSARSLAREFNNINPTVTRTRYRGRCRGGPTRAKTIVVRNFDTRAPAELNS